MISVLVWKGGRKYPAYWYNRLRRAVERTLHAKHEFVVIADDPSGLDQEIRVVMDWPELCQHGMYRRLRMLASCHQGCPA